VPDRPAPQELLVYFHGAHAGAADGLALLTPVADLGTLVLLLSSRRSTWDLAQGGLGPDVASLDTVLGDVLVRYSVSRLAFAGFSDGASYALTLALANGDLVEHVLGFSPGYYRSLPALGKPRIWVSHGRDDPVLPVELCGRKVVTQLRQQRYDVQYTEFDGGHVVTSELALTAAQSWLGKH
jgi:phospholipase/carboxylesterase